MGLMQAIELVEDQSESKTPAPEATAALAMEAARENRLLLIGKGGTYGNVIRDYPTAQYLQAGCRRFRA